MRTRPVSDLPGTGLPRIATTQPAAVDRRGGDVHGGLVTGKERLTVYWRPGCPYCARLRARLRLGRMPYRGVNIWEDPEAAAVVRAHNGGDELVPTVCLDDDRWFSNPSVRTLRAAMRG